MITPLALAGVGVQWWRRARAGGARDQAQSAPVWRPVSAAAASRVAALDQYDRVVERFARRSLVLFAGTTLGALVNPAFTVVTVPFLVVHAVPLFRDGYLELRAGKLGGGAVRALVGGGMLLTRAFWVLSLSGALYGYIDKLQVRAWRRAEHRLGRVFGELPRTARVRRGAVDPEADAGSDPGAGVEVALEDLVAGDLVVVSEGQIIPADGRIERGEARIDQRALTGESSPVAAAVGDGVLAAGVVRSGRISIRVERAGAATRVAGLDELLNRAADHRAAVERTGEVIAERSVAPALALAALAQVLLGTSASICALSAYPGDGTRMVMQLSLLRYLRHAAEQRILIKDARALESLPAIDMVVFDATPAVLTELARDGGALVAALRGRGLTIAVLSGAGPADAEHVAGQIGIDRVVAGSSPERKAEQIRAWRARGQRVCVVGDGVAGARVLCAGDISVSLAGMATAADDAAGVVLLDGGLAKLPLVFDLAKDFTSNLRHNLLAQLAPSPILMAGIFLLGFRTVATLVLTSAGVLIATANATVIAERRLAALDEHAPAPAESAAARPGQADAEVQLGQALATAVHTVKRGFRQVLGSLDHRLGAALTAIGRAGDRIAVIDNES